MYSYIFLVNLTLFKNKKNMIIKEKQIKDEKPHGILGVDYNVACTHINIRGLEYRYPLNESKSFTISKTINERQLCKAIQREIKNR